MTGSDFFLRSRGKVSGPFDADGLRRLIRQGTLSRIHEISADRVTWTPAADYEDLFPGRAASPAAPGRAAAPPDPDVDPIGSDATPPAAASNVVRYFYAQSGAAVGPISLAVLKLLAQNRTLSSGDLVWRENAETGTPAAHVPALSPYFSPGVTPALEYAAPAAATPALSDKQARSRQRALQSLGSGASATGVIAGGVMLLCLILPWFVVENRSFFWWDLYRVPGSGAWAAFCTYLTMATVALCVVSPLTHGMARGIALVSISGVAFFFLIGAFLDSDAAGGPAFGVLVPVALAGLLGVCSFRMAAPEAPAGRIILGICGGVVTLGLLTSGIFWSSQNGVPAGMTGAVVFGSVMLVIGAIAGLAAGVTAFVGLKPRFTPELNLSTLACALAGLALPAIGIFIACLGALNAFSSFLPSSDRLGSLPADARFVVAQALLRVLVLWGGTLAVFATGLAELLLASSIAQSRGTRQV